MPSPKRGCIGPCSCPRVLLHSRWITRNGEIRYPPPPYRSWPLKLRLCEVRRRVVQLPLFPLDDR